MHKPRLAPFSQCCPEMNALLAKHRLYVLISLFLTFGRFQPKIISFCFYGTELGHSSLLSKYRCGFARLFDGWLRPPLPTFCFFLSTERALRLLWQSVRTPRVLVMAGDPKNTIRTYLQTRKPKAVLAFRALNNTKSKVCL